MITKKTALKEAGRFAAALEGPLGRRPLQRVVSEFYPFFQRMRESGASWSQIAALLAAAGIRSHLGRPLSDGVLRAMVSRAGRVPGGPDSTGKGKAKQRMHRAAADRRKVTETPAPPVDTRLQLQRTNAALPDVAERIRRASALRTGEGSADCG